MCDSIVKLLPLCDARQVDIQAKVHVKHIQLRFPLKADSQMVMMKIACRFDEECRGQVADGLKGRGIHLYPETSPTRYQQSHPSMRFLTSSPCLQHFAYHQRIWHY